MRHDRVGPVRDRAAHRGVVRNIKTTDDGKNIVMAESGVNKIALVEIGGAAGSR